jgi:hypothetical protein
MKRVALYKPKHSKITPLEKTIAVKRLFCITGAGWIKATVLAQEWTDRKLIKLNNCNGQLTHCCLPSIHSAAAVCTKIDTTTSSSL